MIKKTFLAVVLTALVLGALPMTFAQGMSIDKVCLVTDVGKVNDGTFNQYAYEGMLAAAEEFDLDNSYIETTSDTEYAGNIDTCIQGGAQVVITVGFLIANATTEAAIANPNVYFIGVDQFQMDGPSNYVGIQFREDQAGFLVGALAALVAEEFEFDTIGAVYGIAIPPVVKFRNGYEQGARYINPDINILGVYIDSFVDRAAGAAAATQQIGEGAGIIFGAGGPTGSGAIAEAAAQGVFVIGVDQDEYFTTFGSGATEGAEYIVSSALKKVDVGVYDMIAALVEGDMDAFPGGGIYILDVANGGISFGPKHDADVPDEIYEAVAEIEAKLVSGEIETGVDPVTGELLDASASSMDMSNMTIAEIVVASTSAETPEFTVLLAAVAAADPSILEALSNPDAELTVFAPTDAAFMAALEALGMDAATALADTELLNSVLTYHVVEGAVMSGDLSTMMVPTLNGAELSITVSDSGVMVNDANVVTADIVASNGVIHVIDAVLLPPSN
jgi:basic membrane lipoprotein Med (substrate-binding protein (PBP1-ABC) superfamily)